MDDKPNDNVETGEEKNNEVWNPPVEVDSATFNDVWDDSQLIKLYEDSQIKIVEAMKKASLKENAKENDDGQQSDCASKNKKSIIKCNKKKNQKPAKQIPVPDTSINMNPEISGWKIGDFCRVLYPFDNGEYEAKILSINPSENQCLIQYLGYEDEEWRKITDLKPSFGENFRSFQVKSAIENGYCQKVTTDDGANAEETSKPTVPTVPKQATNQNQILPPPPLLASNSAMVSEEDQLASMLMSWYMTGYHTGYYQAHRDMKNQECCCKCQRPNKN